MIHQQDIDRLSCLTRSHLIQLINAKSPIERTAAIRLLSMNGAIDIDTTNILLERLCLEKSLYTKLEICTALEKGNIETAKQMTNYLGRIGNNQHKSLPDAVSKKASYPLPRDIIARTLSKMDSSVLPVLLKVLSSQDEMKISEAIDAIGFMIFYHRELATGSNLRILVETMDRYADKEIIYWKAVICLSAFDLKESTDILDNIIASSKKIIIKDEAIRSKSILLRKK